MYKNVIRRTQPAAELVTLSEVKEQLRIDDSFTLDDDLLTGYIKAAREKCENYCNRFFAQSDFTVLYDSFESPLFMPFPDSVVTGVTYVDMDDNSQTLTTYSYDADFQEITADNFDAKTVKVNITSGATNNSVKQAILLYVADFYEVRTAEKAKPNLAAEAILYPYRVEIGA